MKPIIGISTAWSFETWGDPPARSHIYTGAAYCTAIYRCGGLPFLLALPPGEAPDRRCLETVAGCLLERLDGLILSGGGDARRFTPPEVPDLAGQQPQRYRFETLLIRKARELKMPAVGICRGHQMIAEYLGGKIGEQLMEGHQQEGEGTAHPVYVIPGTKLAGLVQEGAWLVNSFHCQVVETPPPHFIPAARSNEGLIEAMESRDGSFWFGFQFHLEMLAGDMKADRFFCAFIEAAGQYRQTRLRQ